MQSLSSLQRVAGGCRHDLVARGEGECPREVGRTENGGQRREGQKELEKGQNQHDLNEINTNTKVKLEEKQRQQREARAGMGGNSRCKWTPRLVSARPGGSL